MKLYIDAKEPVEIQEKIRQEINQRVPEVSVEIKGLRTGDIVFQDLVIERKKDSDLISSIIDRRLTEQTDRMARDFEQSYVLVEGNPFTHPSGLHINSLLGTYASLAEKKNISILNVDNADHLATIIAMIVDHHANSDYDPEQQMLKRTRADTEDVFIAMLTCIRGISKEKAEEISSKFPTMADLVTKSQTDSEEVKTELMTIDGIGEILAERIVNSLEEK